MSAPPAKPDQRPLRQYPPGHEQLSPHSKRTLRRLARAAVLITSAGAALAAGIVIGNAARKRVDKWVHAYAAFTC